MLFWIAAAALTFFAVLFVVLPLGRKDQAVEDRVALEKEMFRARKQEIEKDVSLGRIDAEEGRLAIAEESRRLIAAVETLGGATRSTSGAGFAKAAAVLSIIAVPLIALGTYLPYGNPELPDQPLEARQQADPEQQSVEELLARAEAHLSANPDDARGWAVLAPVYSRIGRYQEAAQAWQNVLRIQPDSDEIRANLAEAMVAAADGVVTVQAQRLFEEELARNIASAKSRFYLAMAKDQEGSHLAAIEMWDELIAGGTDQSPWMAAARQFRQRSAELAGLPVATDDGGSNAAPGPTQEQIDAAGEMSPEDQQAMIRTMVDGLAERLRDDPSDQAGWKRLVRAYIVLGETEQLNDAISRAIEAHQGDAAFVDEMKMIAAQAQAAPGQENLTQ